MFYDRKIKYLDYYEDGVRVRGGGFVKLEARDTNLRVEVVVSGLHPNDSFTRDIVLRSGKQESIVGKIAILNGRGQYRQLCQDLKDIEGTGIGYDELQGVYISLGTGRELSCSWPARELTVERGNQGSKIGVRESASHGNGMNEAEEGNSRRGMNETERESRRRGMDEAERESHRRGMNEAEEGNSRRGMNETERESRRRGMDEAELESRRRGMDEAEEGNSRRGMDEAEEKRRRNGMDEAEEGRRRNGVDEAEREKRRSGMNEAERENYWYGMNVEKQGSNRNEMNIDEGNYYRSRMSAAKEESSQGGMLREEETHQSGRAEGEVRQSGMSRAEGEVRQSGMSRAEGEVRQSGMNRVEGEVRQSGISKEKEEVRQNGMSREKEEVRQSGMSTTERNDHRGRISDIEASESDRWGSGKGGQYAVNRQKENEDKMNSNWKAEQESAGNGRREKTGIQKADAGKPVKLLEDKWLQLCAIYPHIHPFRDKREYLSIGPADFVLFPAASYKLVNNSFLLHGYYNYHHLILTRLEQKGEYRYYIGVPGSYFEKEKQVAIMFGFESFECESEPAQIGDFGYYMMRTEL